MRSARRVRTRGSDIASKTADKKQSGGIPCSGMIDHRSLSNRLDNSLLVVLVRCRFPSSVRTIHIGAVCHFIDVQHFVNERPSVAMVGGWRSPPPALQRLAGL